MEQDEHDIERDKAGETGFYVVPISNCPHLKVKENLPSEVDAKSPCQDCKNEGENWVCLTCGGVFCSRYVHQHMVKHNQETQHPVAVSFSDFSCWCYSCDSYIKSASITPVVKAMHQSKFGHVPPTGQTTFVPTGVNRVGVITDEEEIKEHFDPPDVVEKKAKIFAEMLRKATHAVCYTGAGISTSANIPDYRGPQGIWTLRAQGKSSASSITLEQAQPTSGHMALVELCKRGLLKSVVSTNVDGLHLRSGVPRDQLAELHGNIYLERCSQCEAEYLRPFDVTKNRRGRYTGRICEKMIEHWKKSGETEQIPCKGKLRDTIVNFGESLPHSELEKSIEHSEKSDLSLVLGTSMRVSPANQLPLIEKGDIVIVNLQKTPFDHRASLRVFARTDDFLKLVMQELGFSIPQFKLDEDELLKEMDKMIFDENS